MSSAPQLMAYNWKSMDQMQFERLPNGSSIRKQGGKEFADELVEEQAEILGMERGEFQPDPDTEEMHTEKPLHSDQLEMPFLTHPVLTMSTEESRLSLRFLSPHHLIV